MMAQACGYQPGDFIHTFGDAHIYINHMEQIELQLSREPKTLPTLKINPNKTDIFEFAFSDFTIKNYDPHPHIKGAVAV
jgi:thymidylate synthase